MYNGESWLKDFEQREKDRTGIPTLKVGYNKVFGYFIEVTNTNLGKVPADYIRKQTLTGAERFITDELKKHEDEVLTAQVKAFELEYKLFCNFRDYSKEFVSLIRETAECIAKLDVFTSFASVAVEHNYVCPVMNESGDFFVKNGRHPVLEQILPLGNYVANDIELSSTDRSKTQFMILTGPNMAGKSTYMRQNALIAILAQIGSFIPADYAEIGIVDKIFTRVGASDDLTLGKSTFMVEMTETACILNSATDKSLILIDEIGRGTSTFDGLSIAWAVVEYISNPKLLGAKTLFATHYHELTELEGKLNSVNNYCIAVKEKGDDIVFLRKIVKGGADKSYGIQVAKLAGIPELVINRAKDIVNQLSANDITETVKNISVEGQASGKKKKPHLDEVDLTQMSLFDTVKDDDIIQELRDVDISHMTPMDALNKLYELQNKVKNRW